MKQLQYSMLSIVVLVLFGTTAFAQQATVDGMFSLQGRLTTGTSNTAIADGQYTLTLRVFEAGTNNVIATETDVVSTLDGIFSTMVGDNSSLSVEAGTDYEIGLSIDGGAELSPRIMIGEALSAATADVAANAEAVGGFTVGTTGPNTIVTTDAQGRINTDLLGSSLVTSINGQTGNVNLNVTGSGVTFENDGNGNLNLNITGGSGGGSLELPFTGSANVSTNQSVLRLTSMGQGTAATLLNNGGGSALNLSSSGSGSASLDITNTAGSAITATGSMTSGAVLNVQNTATGANANIMAGLNASGNTVFSVAGNGQTTINSTVENALDVTTNAASGATMRLRNAANNANARLISGLNNAGNTAFEVLSNGRTRIESTVENALDVTTNAASGAAMRIRNTATDANSRLISAVNGAGNTAFEVMGNGQTRIQSNVANALDVTTNAGSGAAMRIQNMASDANARLIEAVNAGGTTAFEVMGNGRTVINSTVNNALDVSTDVSGGTALRVDGGLALPQAVGTGTLNAGSTSVTINNALVKANSVVMLTVNSATSLANGIRLSGQGNGSFTVSLLDTTLGALGGNLTFNYLIINQ